MHTCVRVTYSDFDEEKSKELRLQIALRYQAIKIRDVSRDPKRFDGYISEREAKIREIIGKDTEVFEGDKIVFP